MKRLAMFVSSCVFSALSFSAQAASTLTPLGNVSILGSNYSVSLLSDFGFEAQSFGALNPSITFNPDNPLASFRPMNDRRSRSIGPETAEPCAFLAGHSKHQAILAGVLMP